MNKFIEFNIKIMSLFIHLRIQMQNEIAAVGSDFDRFIVNDVSKEELVPNQFCSFHVESE